MPFVSDISEIGRTIFTLMTEGLLLIDTAT